MSEHAENTQHTVAEVHQPDSGHVSKTNPLLSLDPGLSIWFWLSFIIFIILIWKFGWKLLNGVMKERRDSIKNTLDEAEAARKSLEQASARQQELIEEGRQRADEIAQRAENSAKKLADELDRKARQESEKIIESAKIQIQNQKEQALAELKSEVVQLAVSVATKLIKDNLDEERNQKLVKDYIEEISS